MAAKSKHAARKKKTAAEARTFLAQAEDLTTAELEDACRAVLTRLRTITADDDAAPKAAPAAPRTGAVRALWGGHWAFFTPFGWIMTADAAALAARCAVHVAGTGGQAAGLAAVTVTGAALTRTVIRVRRRRDKKTRKLAPPSPAARRARRRAVRAWAAAASWAPLVIWWTPAGPYGMVQIILILGGLWLSRDHLFAHRRQHQPRAAITGPAQPAGPGPDARLEAFRRRFITGTAAGRGRPPLTGAELHSLADVRDGAGFTFGIRLDADSEITFDTVVALRSQIGGLYDVPKDQVLIDRGPRRSESRAQITVLTADDAYAEPQRWDGQSTYDPATGCIGLGLFGDTAVAHWRLHAPGSGSWGGMIIGVPGTGKTGDAHVIASEAGIAMVCTACGAARPADGTCQRCDPRRICAVIMGDPQRQPFGVWRGRADLTGWGPAGSVHLLRMLHAAMTERAAEMGTEEWTDAKGRVNTGRGWFDPTPDRPELLGLFDEWPKIIASPGGAEAADLAEAIEAEGRKVGVSIGWLAQMPDVGQTGDDRVIREMMKGFNAVGHRLDGTSKAMIGIDGDARDLPEGKDMYGIGYIGGYDGRSAAAFRTKYLPEIAGEGVDVRDLADRVAATPVTFDAPVLRAFSRFGFTGRCQVFDDDTVAAWRRTQDRKRPAPPVAAPGPAGPGGGPGPVSTGALDTVAAALDAHTAEHGQGAELYDVMTATGLAAGPAGRALAALAASGRARQSGPGTWSPIQHPEGATV